MKNHNILRPKISIKSKLQVFIRLIQSREHLSIQIRKKNTFFEALNFKAGPLKKALFRGFPEGNLSFTVTQNVHN